MRGKRTANAHDSKRSRPSIESSAIVVLACSTWFGNINWYSYANRGVDWSPICCAEDCRADFSISWRSWYRLGRRWCGVAIGYASAERTCDGDISVCQSQYAGRVGNFVFLLRGRNCVDRLVFLVISPPTVRIRRVKGSGSRGQVSHLANVESNPERGCEGVRKWGNGRRDPILFA